METKINISVGNLSFSGEGDQGWLAAQLDKVLKAAPAIAEVQRGADEVAPKSGAKKHGQDSTPSLAAYIREKKGDINQVDRFLITADWLRKRGAAQLATAAISKALRDNQQKKLANPADCLNKNVSKGFCEKAGGGFFITPDGMKHLGYAD